MMGELSQECRLADARLAGDLDRKAGVERRESCGELAAIEQPSHRFRTKENRRRSRTSLCSIASRRVANQRAGGIANLQDVAADRYVPGDRAVQRLRVRIVRSNSRMIGSVQDQLGVSRMIHMIRRRSGSPSPADPYTLRKALADLGLDIDEGTLYPLLRRLESQDLLTSQWREEGGRNKRFYRLSPDGRQMLKQLLAEWKGLNASLDRIV